jgi:hypothetical protein
MTEQEREELIEKIAERINEMRLFQSTNTETARAVLAVAEPVIREQCARIVEKGNYETRWTESERAIHLRAARAAIREGKKDV